MVTNRYPCGSIDVYAFRDSNGDELSAAPMKLSSLKCTSLLLPALQASNQYAIISSHTSPFTSQVPKGTPFASSEDARIHVLSVTTRPSQPTRSNSDSELSVAPPGRAASFVVVVLNKILLKYSSLASGPSSPVLTEIPWEEWGPRNTRWLPERSSHAWQRSVGTSLTFSSSLIMTLPPHTDMCMALALCVRSTAPGLAQIAGCKFSISACIPHVQRQKKTLEKKQQTMRIPPCHARTSWSQGLPSYATGASEVEVLRVGYHTARRHSSRSLARIRGS